MKAKIINAMLRTHLGYKLLNKYIQHRKKKPIEIANEFYHSFD